MSHGTPFFSIVIPTRNRPELLKYALQSLLLQTFTDFEVIVCDNHTGKPCRSVFDQYSDQRFKYVTPLTPLQMHDNWQFACNFAQGEYITVLMDKSILRPSALQIIYDNLVIKPAEIISWSNETFIPSNEDMGYEDGIYVPTHIKSAGPRYYDPKVELKRRISCGSSAKSDAEGSCYYWGKICFGAYQHNLVQRINDALGKMIYPLCSDYTSMIAALAFAESAIDAGEPLSITFASKLSNGYNGSVHPDYALRVLHEIDPSDQILQEFPIKGLYTSVHNIVAYDYASMKVKIGKPMQNMEIDMKNLVLLAKDDLDNVIWRDLSVKHSQMKIWETAYRELSLHQRMSVLFTNIFAHSIISEPSKKFKNLVISLLNIFPKTKTRLKSKFCKRDDVFCKTIFDAATLADDFYSKRNDT